MCVMKRKNETNKPYFEYINIGDSVMILQRHTEFIDQGEAKAVVFNQRDLYRRSD